MENVAQAIRQGQGAASGAASITVEKHKNNFFTQHGTFEDKPSQNITRWLEKADIYKAAHMIESLDMASIIIHCIKGEPAIKVRRMLDVPGNNYIHADYYCQQPIQQAVAYQPYRERREIVNAVQAQPDANPPVLGVQGEPAQEARPAILPMRFQPAVAANQCLRHYLVQLYGKRVNLSEAEKFLNTFKLQNTKQTCSNYLDEFVINYENYAHLKWTTRQLNGVEHVAPVQANPAANPPVEEVVEVMAEPGNQALRNAEMIQLATDGICKEFKIHCDNIQYDLNATTFPELEQAVMNWQRSTTTGKAFTAACIPAKLGSKNAHVSALEMDDYIQENMNKLTLIDAQTNSTQVSSASTRGQRGGRGGRGSGRGARGREGRGRGAPTNTGIPYPKASLQSRDIQDGGYHNYRQAQDGTLHKSIHGHLLCNYCGVPSHKRENCTRKAADREAGLTRAFHPDRDKAFSNLEVKRITAAATARESAATASAAAAMSATPMMQYYPWSLPWTNPLAAGQAPFQGAVNPWQYPQQAMVNEARLEYDQKTPSTQLTPIPSAAQTAIPNPCPYPTCQAILPDQHVAQEHIRMYHAQPATLAKGQEQTHNV